MELDQADYRILRELQKDSGRTTSEIASAAGMSQAACWRRLEKLKAGGLILQQCALLDRRKLGFGTHVFARIKLTTEGRADPAAFADAVAVVPEIVECYTLLGPVDNLFRVVTVGIDTYERLLFEKLFKLPGIRDISSVITLSEVKLFSGLPL